MVKTWIFIVLLLACIVFTLNKLSRNAGVIFVVVLGIVISDYGWLYESCVECRDVACTNYADGSIFKRSIIIQEYAEGH